ncbi:MAG: GIY-YIG nuclease family protein [Candidatus Ornithospirochaeta sp.]
MSEIKGVIYILTNPSFPEYVKIGYAKDIEQRLLQLNRSETIPFAFRVYATYDVVTPLSDLILHDLIDGLNPDLRAIETFNGKKRTREFYEMTPEYAYNILSSIAKLSGTESRLKRIKPEGHEVEDIKMAEEAEKAYRRGPFTFSSVGINPGEIISFVPDLSITATVVDDKHIRIGETVTSLSGAAKSILHKNALQGPKFWSYNGRILDDIRTEKENGGF